MGSQEVCDGMGLDEKGTDEEIGLLRGRMKGT